MKTRIQMRLNGKIQTLMVPPFRLLLDLLRDGATWDEIGERLGRRADAARMRFHRKTAPILSERRR